MRVQSHFFGRLDDEEATVLLCLLYGLAYTIIYIIITKRIFMAVFDYSDWWYKRSTVFECPVIQKLLWTHDMDWNHDDKNEVKYILCTVLLNIYVTMAIFVKGLSLFGLRYDL